MTGWLACKTHSSLPAGCETSGRVTDFSDLDGCGLLIILDNGEVLNPVVVPAGFTLKDGQNISFSFKKLAQQASTCMKEDYQVEITCIARVGSNTGGQAPCTDTDNPFEVEWMDHAIDLHNPNQILKYKRDDGWAYLFHSFPKSFLYHCTGKLICSTNNDHDPCFTDYIGSPGGGKIIWQGEGVWD